MKINLLTGMEIKLLERLVDDLLLVGSVVCGAMSVLFLLLGCVMQPTVVREVYEWSSAPTSYPVAVRYEASNNWCTDVNCVHHWRLVMHTNELGQCWPAPQAH